jgi:hypothetical protein
MTWQVIFENSFDDFSPLGRLYLETFNFDSLCVIVRRGCPPNTNPSAAAPCCSDVDGAIGGCPCCSDVDAVIVAALLSRCR